MMKRKVPGQIQSYYAQGADSRTVHASKSDEAVETVEEDTENNAETVAVETDATTDDDESEPST